MRTIEEITRSRKLFEERNKNWHEVIKMAKSAQGLKSSICEGCGSGRIRDEVGNIFVITRNTNLKELEIKIKEMQQCQKAQ